MVERRRTIRAVVRWEVYDSSSPPERIPLYISNNISSNGMFLITQQPYPPGTHLRIRFTLPGHHSGISALGKVIWRRTEREAPDRQPGMGVQFVEIKESDQERIRAFVQARLKEAGQ